MVLAARRIAHVVTMAVDGNVAVRFVILSPDIIPRYCAACDRLLMGGAGGLASPLSVLINYLGCC